MQGIKEKYTKRAERYDVSANLYYLKGVRINAYPQNAVQALQLSRGNSVLELGE